MGRTLQEILDSLPPSRRKILEERHAEQVAEFRALREEVMKQTSQSRAFLAKH